MANLLEKAKKIFQKVPASPTNPHKTVARPEFKIEDLFETGAA
jgi:hypothetical protein